MVSLELKFCDNGNTFLKHFHFIFLCLFYRKEHLDEYKESCINDWTEVATESDMTLSNFYLGRIASFTTRFCQSKKNMPFCGELLFQYVLLATLRDALKAETMGVVLRSRFHNQHFKLKALHEELEASRLMDKSYIEPIINRYVKIQWNLNLRYLISVAMGKYFQFIRNV